MLYVRPRHGLAGVIDPERRDRLPTDKWRPVTASRYWHRLQQDGDVELREAQVLPAGQAMPKWDGVPRLREEDIEGYVAPAIAVATADRGSAE